MAALKLISVNVERSKHLDTVLPFIEHESPDILCVQELNDRDVEAFARFGPHHSFEPMLRHLGEAHQPFIGVGMFSRAPAHFTSTYYVHSKENIPVMDHNLTPVEWESPAANVLVVADVDMGAEVYRIATTHFTWSPRGEATEQQRADLQALKGVLERLDEFTLCGDFNAPRGGEIFAALATDYHDNIPPAYRTSIDISLHRAGKERPHELADKMVDGLFTTPGYRASNVHLVDGVSDHMAIVANISRN